MSFRDLWTYWQRFWFTPESPVAIGVFRILFGMIALEWCLLVCPNLFNWFGTRGICSVQCSQQVLAGLGPLGVNILNWMPPSNTSIGIVFYCTAIATVFLTLGLFTRVSAVCVYLGLASFQQQNCLIMNGGDILLKMSAFYLIFSPAGSCLSLDRLFKSKQRPTSEQSLQSDQSGWARRLYCVLIALIYFQAFWSKLGETTWLDGSAIYYVLREQEFLRFPVPWIADNLWMCKMLTWGTLIVEGSMWSLVWFKETRYFALAGALLLHLGIEYTMNLPVFESLMIASLVAFVPSQDLKSAYYKVRSVFVNNTGRIGAQEPTLSVHAKSSRSPDRLF